MARLPTIISDTAEGIARQLNQVFRLIEPHLPNDADPVLIPRNVRCQTVSVNTIRVRWDTGSINADGYDVSISETADFTQSQARRVVGMNVGYLDLTVGDTNKRYFRVRAYKGQRVSKWSNIAKGLANVATPSGVVSGNPGTVAFTPYLTEYGFIGIKDVVLTGNADMLKVMVAYVDEPQAAYLYVQFTAAFDSSTDPISVAGTVVNHLLIDAVSIDILDLVVGDFLAIDDPANDSGHASYRSYEIFKVTAIGGGTITLARHETGQAAGKAYFQSYLSAHLAGLRAYKLNFAHFAIPTKNSSGDYEAILDQDFPLPSACVVSVSVAASDVGFAGSYTTHNCAQLAYPFPGEEYQRPPAPGMRTCNGDKQDIVIPGPLLALAISQNPPLVPVSSSIRGVIATVRIKASGFQTPYVGMLATVPTASLAGYVLCVEPKTPGVAQGSRKVAVLEQFATVNTEFDSFSSQTAAQYSPKLRRTPFNLTWPCVTLPVVGTLETIFDLATGLVREGAMPFAGMGTTLRYTEACELYAILERTGSDIAGADLTVAVLT